MQLLQHPLACGQLPQGAQQLVVQPFAHSQSRSDCLCGYQAVQHAGLLLLLLLMLWLPLAARTGTWDLRASLPEASETAQACSDPLCCPLRLVQCEAAAF